MYVVVLEVLGDKIRCKGSGMDNITLPIPDIKYFYRNGKRIDAKRCNVSEGDYFDHPSLGGLFSEKYRVNIHGKVKTCATERERKRWVKQYMNVKLKIDWNGYYIGQDVIDDTGNVVNKDEKAKELIDEGFKNAAKTLLEDDKTSTVTKKDEDFRPKDSYVMIAKNIMTTCDESDIGIAYIKKITNKELHFVIGKSKAIREKFDDYSDKTKKTDRINVDDIIDIYNMVGMIEELPIVSAILEIELEEK